MLYLKTTNREKVLYVLWWNFDAPDLILRLWDFSLVFTDWITYMNAFIYKQINPTSMAISVCIIESMTTSLLSCKWDQVISVLVLYGLLLQVIHEGEAIKRACRAFLCLVTLTVPGWEHGVLNHGGQEKNIHLKCMRWTWSVCSVKPKFIAGLFLLCKRMWVHKMA